ncbi:MAG: ATP-binding protein [Gemmatimonadota bacterium]|jgi:serine/threonine-protein kinase RsbW
MRSDLVLELPNDIKAIEHTVEFVVRRCEPSCEDQKRLRLNFRVALTEALSNAMLYGNHRDPAKRVRVEVTVKSCSVIACVTDEGNGFDPEVVPDPTCPMNLCKSGGRGVFLMRKLLDEVRYNDRGNSVTLVLRYGAPQNELRGASA